MDKVMMTTAPDTATPSGKTWLRSTILAYVRAHPGVAEDKILRHVDDVAGDDYCGEIPSFTAEHLLFEMVAKDKALNWYEQRGKPDAPLRYSLAGAHRTTKESDARL